MNETDSIKVFDGSRMFSQEGIPASYLAEIGLRTTIMFLILIIALKFLSKRGVKQLSVFELAILIALGSATGDPMFYNNIPLTYGIVVLVVVIVLYRSITGLTGKSKMMESLLEGKPICLLKDGKIDYTHYKKVGLPYDKFFAELRMKSVSHLGQVKKVYLETSGDMSIYLFDEKEILPGLPIFPELIARPLEHIPAAGDFACIYCGHVQLIANAASKCSKCEKNGWLETCSDKRVN